MKNTLKNIYRVLQDFMEHGTVEQWKNLWNDYCEDKNYLDEMIYDNNAFMLEELFGEKWYKDKIIEGMENNSYSRYDTYFQVFDDMLVSFNAIYESTFDWIEIAEWLQDNDSINQNEEYRTLFGNIINVIEIEEQ